MTVMLSVRVGGVQSLRTSCSYSPLLILLVQKQDYMSNNISSNLLDIVSPVTEELETELWKLLEMSVIKYVD